MGAPAAAEMKTNVDTFSKADSWARVMAVDDPDRQPACFERYKVQTCLNPGSLAHTSTARPSPAAPTPPLLSSPTGSGSLASSR